MKPPKCGTEMTIRGSRQKFGITKLSSLRCSVCDSEFIDLDKCSEGETKHIGKARKHGGSG